MVNLDDPDHHLKTVLQDWNLGFPLPDGKAEPQQHETAKRWRTTIQRKIKSQEKRFRIFFQKHNLANMEDTKLIKKLVRKGIPSVHRPECYFVLSGARNTSQLHPEYYKDLHQKIRQALEIKVADMKKNKNGSTTSTEALKEVVEEEKIEKEDIEKDVIIQTNEPIVKENSQEYNIKSDMEMQPTDDTTMTATTIDETDDDFEIAPDPNRAIDTNQVDIHNIKMLKRFQLHHKMIRGDVPRTYPQHPYYQLEENREALSRLLSAYAFHNTAVGYCQGLNFVAGMMLLVMNDEDKAFWTLHRIIESYLPADMYSDNMKGLFCEANVLQRLLEDRRPKLFKHMMEIVPHFEVFCTQWFLCLYCGTMPVETTLRIWDAFFLESYKILYRVALTLLTQIEPQLMAADDMGAMVPLLQESPTMLYDCRSFIKSAFKIRRFRRTTILKYRTAWRHAHVPGSMDVD